MSIPTTPQNLAVFGQDTTLDSTLIATFGYLSAYPPHQGSLYKKDFETEMPGYLPEQFKTQPWKEYLS